MASSTPVDPNQLLKALSTLLSKEGGIKGVTEVPKLLVLMKSARKMVSRCIYINILIATKEREIYEKFIQEGGWELLNSWLHDAKNNELNPVIIELIKVFKELPVTIEVLKKNNTAKIIKLFSKAEGEEVSELKSMADDLVTTWMGVIRTTNEKVKEKEKSPVAKKKKKMLKKPGKSIGGDDRDADDESDEPASKKLRVGSVSESEPMDTHEVHKRGDSPKGKHATAKLGSRSPTASRKNSTEELAKKAEDGKKDDTKKRTAKISRPGHTKFRSTGLEKDADLPPPKMKKKSAVQPPPPAPVERRVPPLIIKKNGPIFSKSLSPIDKKSKPQVDDHSGEKKAKTEEKKESKPHPEEHSKTSMGGHGKIKLIPAKPKLQESSGFLDALNAPSLALKKKIPKKVSRQNSTGSNKAKSPTTPPEEVKVEPPKFSFYSSNQEEKKKEEVKPSTPEPAKEEETKEAGDMPEDWNEERAITVGKSNLKFGPSRKKKKVTWKDDTDLVDVCFFELDENERINVNRVKDFQGAMANEKLMEKQAILNVMKYGGKAEEDDTINGNTTVEYFKWRRPHLIDLPPVLIDYGGNSLEKDVQAKREGTVLQEIFFDQMHIPFTPKEPDPESKKMEPPKMIPLEDEASAEQGGEAQYQPEMYDPNFGQFPMHGHDMGHGMMHAPGGHAMPPGGGPHGMPINGPHGPPHGTPPNQKPPMGAQGNTPPSPNTTIKNVQNLLASLSEGEAKPGSDLLNKENLEKLKEMLEPFKTGHSDNQGPQGGNMPPFQQGPGNFGPRGPSGPHPGGPGDFGPNGPYSMGQTGLLGHGPGLGPQFDGPRMDGPYGPGFGPGPNFSGPGRGMGPHGGFDMGPGDFPSEGGGMGPRGPWRGGRGRGRGRGGRGRGKQRVCYHWKSSRGCISGDKCHFQHPDKS